jgi:general secretion pathway protein I
MSRASTRSRPDAGFSLVEALVALFVFALAGVALVELQSYSLATFSRVEQQALGGMVAHNKLTETLASYQTPDLGVSRGETKLGGRQWRWRMNVAATEDPVTRRVEVEVADAATNVPAARAHAFVSAGAQ